MIAVIDYGMGNLRSVQKALEHLGEDIDIVSDPERLSLADKAVLPGVGAFKDTMDGIESRGLTRTIREFIDSGKPYLGICMGLQVLFSESEEGGRFKGLGVLKGKVKKFKAKKNFKVPHMGWNQMKVRKKECPLVKGIEDETYFYFDPPFSSRKGMDDVYDKTIALIESIEPEVAELVIIEHMTSLDMPDEIGAFELMKRKKFGRSTMTYYKSKE